MDLVSTALSFLGLKGPPEGGKSPESRLTSANDARQLLQACIREDNDGGRAYHRAVTKGAVDGNPPYDDFTRKQEGRGWEANLNFLKGRAIMNRTAVPYYNLFARVPYFAETRTAFQPDNPEHEHWCAAISRRFHNLLKRWKPGFNWCVQDMSYWMRLHGVGFAFFDVDGDWRFRSIETGKVLAPKGSPSCLDKRVPYCFIRVPYRITELWQRIKDEEYATKTGVNVEAVKTAIKYGMRGQIAPNSDWYTTPWETYQRILTNHDYTASFTDGDIVNCAVMLLQEWNGKISKFLFTESPVFADQDPKKASTSATDNEQFLFADPNCYDNYLEALVPFFRNTGDGTWHSVRGYAMEAFKHVEVENRMLCQAINREFVNSSIVLQFPNERGRQQSQLQVVGTVIKLPVGAEFKQVVIQGTTEGMVTLQRLVSNHLDSNLGVGAPRSISREDGRGEQPTARQVDYVAANEASISEGEITIWYEQKDSLYTEMFNRAADPSTSDEEAKRFQQECLNDGVPKEALADMEFVRANRQNGYGSPEMGIMKFNQSKELVPMLPEDGKQNWLEDMVTVIHGPDKTARYAPRLHLPNDDDWMAAVENQMIAGGRLPIISGEQDDVVHLQSHFQDAEQTLTPATQQLQQMNGSSDPNQLQQAVQYAQIMSQHVMAHISRLQRDPSRKAEAKLFEDQFKQLAENSQELWRGLRQARRQQMIEQEQNQQATALSALDQAKVTSVQTGTALAAAKTRSAMQNQTAKTVHGMRIKEAQATQDMRLERQKALNVPKDVAKSSGSK